MKDCDTIPTHFNQQFASTTQLWSGTDSEKKFNQNCKTKEQYIKLKSLGWLEPGAITYKHNSHGFRDGEFDQQPAGMALGCSHTFGVGVKHEQAWPTQLQRMMGQKIWNLGIDGAALDTCYRMLEYWIQHLNIKFVVCAVPGISRYEVFDSNWSNILPSMKLEPAMQWLQGYHRNYLSFDQNSELNRRKNLQAMQYICDQHGVPFYYDLLDQFFDSALARDLLHCGHDAHTRLAAKFLQMMESQ